MLKLHIENILVREEKIMAEWISKKLGEITLFITKGIPPKYVEEENQNTVRVLNQKCNRNFEISYDESRIHNAEIKKVPEDKLLRCGDVLINSTGTGTAGRVAQLFNVSVPTTIDGHMILLRPTEEINSIYYGYAIKSQQKKIESLAEGSTGQTEINRQRLKDEIIITFPKEKMLQKAIGTLLLQIDEKIKNNKQINNNLEQQAQAVYYKMFSEVNTVPVELSSIIDVRDGTHDSPKAQATGYYLITSKHLLPFGVDKASANHISKADFDKINERSLVETQDILMSMIGTIGLISYIPYETVDFAIKNVALFKTSHTPELAYYFLCYLKSEKTLQHIGKCLAGSTQKYISLGELRKMPIYSPTTNEIREFNCLVKPMFEKIVSRTYENALLAEMRDSLLPKLMSGELDVSKIDI